MFSACASWTRVLIDGLPMPRSISLTTPMATPERSLSACRDSLCWPRSSRIFPPTVRSRSWSCPVEVVAPPQAALRTMLTPFRLSETFRLAEEASGLVIASASRERVVLVNRSAALLASLPRSGGRSGAGVLLRSDLGELGQRVGVRGPPAELVPGPRGSDPLVRRERLGDRTQPLHGLRQAQCAVLAGNADGPGHRGGHLSLGRVLLEHPGVHRPGRRAQ